MRKRWRITALIALLLLALGVMWLMSALRPPALELAPLTIERKLVGMRKTRRIQELSDCLLCIA